ncbi:MAG: 50S ribosomal protein L18 [Candidatus Latescibacteria bacterium 4484_181]|nr:MAG: 50S ribosomal protein L18 [Candidatus Latescibacteria bacterium 4484_181]RKY68240.1 MAG: 50S ribosomal protein L18 [Candidatus Latescibacterota bacterium]RKY72950.1 MAG: 50S ribosomal protein L18 [Candidatus Latescibacterota bacterium]
MEKSKKVALNRQRRHRHIRKKVIGTAQRPRLVVYRSLKHIYAQLVDDISQKSLLGVSTLTPQVREKIRTTKGKCEKSKEVGRFLAMMAKAKGIEKVVFDRAGYLYHGRVKALAEGAREKGLQF